MADCWKTVVLVMIALPTCLEVNVRVFRENDVSCAHKIMTSQWIPIRKGGAGRAPVNLTAEYIANGSLLVTWRDHPDTKIHQYFVNILNIMRFYLPNDTHQYVLLATKPNTVYTIKVSTTSITSIIGTSETSVTTPTAMYRPVDGAAELSLPLPSVGYVILKVNKRQLLSFYFGKLRSTPIPGLSVYVNDTVTLKFDRLTTRDAGYYYIERNLEPEPMTEGQLLVVMDAPTTPLITSSNQSPNLESLVTLKCQSETQSKPVNHGLKMTYSWTLNGSRSDNSRFVVNGSNLIIKSVRHRDRFNRYACVAHEVGQGTLQSPSLSSLPFLLTPLFPSELIAFGYMDNGFYKKVTSSYTGLTSVSMRSQEGQSMVFVVNAIGNPQPDVTLRFRDQTVIAHGTQLAPGTHIIVMDHLQCSHAGAYDVTATNNVSRSRGTRAGPTLRHFMLQVNCLPRMVNYMYNLIEIEAKLNTRVALNVKVTSNPGPQTEWSPGVISLPPQRHNAYTYTVRGEVKVVTASDFRNYKVSISNGLTETLTVTFRIRSEDSTTGCNHVSGIAAGGAVAGVLVIAVSVIIVVVIIKRKRYTVTEEEHTYANVRDGAENSPEAPTNAPTPEHMYVNSVGGGTTSSGLRGRQDGGNFYLTIQSPRVRENIYDNPREQH